MIIFDKESFLSFFLFLLRYPVGLDFFIIFPIRDPSTARKFKKSQWTFYRKKEKHRIEEKNGAAENKGYR